MNRRTFLAVTGSTTLSLSAGCSAVVDETGYTYTLALTESIDEPTEPILAYDTAGLTRGQQSIVEEAIRTGSYTEANVTWNTQPGHEPLTMAYRMLLQLIARHVDHDPTVDHETSFQTPSEYSNRRYRSRVTVE